MQAGMRPVIARFEQDLHCGHHVRPGEPIGKPRGATHWLCWPCANGYQQPVMSRERLFDNPKVAALLKKALVTDSEHEAAVALDAARRLHAQQSGKW
jgi:Protein of unknown function (DUF2786)